ncbi:GNAT family N-acetyltransferase [Streptomyces sp. NPDC007205]|uniref:GNAT family N-acetyltransferase n=1 Tax=Streptomyces sp. NPDC007205 TaxID=3154316 RepID=UPI0034115C87
MRQWLASWHTTGLWLDGRLLGMVRARPVETDWHLGRLAVVPALRGRGLGPVAVAYRRGRRRTGPPPHRAVHGRQEATEHRPLPEPGLPAGVTGWPQRSRLPCQGHTGKCADGLSSRLSSRSRDGCEHPSAHPKNAHPDQAPPRRPFHALRRLVCAGAARGAVAVFLHVAVRPDGEQVDVAGQAGGRVGGRLGLPRGTRSDQCCSVK